MLLLELTLGLQSLDVSFFQAMYMNEGVVRVNPRVWEGGGRSPPPPEINWVKTLYFVLFKLVKYSRPLGSLLNVEKFDDTEVDAGARILLPVGQLLICEYLQISMKNDQDLNI